MADDKTPILNDVEGGAPPPYSSEDRAANRLRRAKRVAGICFLVFVVLCICVFLGICLFAAGASYATLGWDPVIDKRPYNCRIYGGMLGDVPNAKYKLETYVNIKPGEAVTVFGDRNYIYFCKQPPKPEPEGRTGAARRRRRASAVQTDYLHSPGADPFLKRGARPAEDE